MDKCVVMRSTGSWYQVLMPDGSTTDCRLKGKLKISGSKKTNFVAVGDHVVINRDANGECVISEVLPRKNYVIRKATNLSRQWHVLAANLDQALLIITLAEPRTSTGFIDRFLVTCEAYHVQPVLIFNKTDLYTAETKEDLFVYTEVYRSCGYECLETSAVTRKGITELKALLHNRVSLLAGHSGVGKSTLINGIEPALTLRTGSISDYHKKGTHTTTFAEMFPLTEGGFIIDTPGIKELGLVDMEKYELSRYFPEMRSILGQCRFNTCLHNGEPGCAVQKAVEEGTIAAFRYRNYLGMLNSEEMEKEYR